MSKLTVFGIAFAFSIAVENARFSFTFMMARGSLFREIQIRVESEFRLKRRKKENFGGNVLFIFILVIALLKRRRGHVDFLNIFWGSLYGNHIDFRHNGNKSHHHSCLL